MPSPSHCHLLSPVARSYATIAPLVSLPSWTTHRRSTTSGEHDAKKRGPEPLKSSLRHTTLPVAASTQESVSCTPSVTTLPSATVGELRGPTNSLLNPEPGRVGAFAAYLSCQSSFPSAAV